MDHQAGVGRDSPNLVRTSIFSVLSWPNGLSDAVCAWNLVQSPLGGRCTETKLNMDHPDLNPKSRGQSVEVPLCHGGRRWYPRKIRSTCREACFQSESGLGLNQNMGFPLYKSKILYYPVSKFVLIQTENFSKPDSDQRQPSLFN